jgi:hypothetical protein
MADHKKTNMLNVVTLGLVMALTVFVLGVTILNQQNNDRLQAQIEKYHTK